MGGKDHFNNMLLISQNFTIMYDPPSSKTVAMSIQMRAMREHFERLLREQVEQFHQRVDELERRSQNSNDGSGDEDERRRRRNQGKII